MRNRILLWVALAGIAIISISGPIAAHHSFAAQFDRNKRVTLTGPVTKLDWINPHARFFLDAKDPSSGKVTNYEVELSATAILTRRGWTRNSLPIGQTITVEGFMAKDGSNVLNASTVTLPDGKRVYSGDPETGAPPPQK